MKSSERFQLTLTAAKFWLPSLLVLVAQFVADWKNLPIGFESGKVGWLQLAAVLAGVAILHTVLSRPRASGQKLVSFLRSYWLISALAALAVGIVILSSLDSPWREIALMGNPWRASGLMFLICLPIIALNAALHFQKRWWLLLLWVYWLLTVLHAALGISEASQLRWDLVVQGFYVNGNFGQANFFANTVLQGLLTGIFLTVGLWQVRQLTKLTVFGLVAGSLLQLAALWLSFSPGSWFIGFAFALAWAMLAIVFLARVYQSKQTGLAVQNSLGALTPKRLLILSLAQLAAIVIVHLAIWYSDEARRFIWSEVWKVLPNLPFAGFGPDTLHVVLQKFDLANAQLIDRAHNVFLDLLISYGWWGIATFTALVVSLWWRGYCYLSALGKPLALNVLNYWPVVMISCYVLTDIFHTKSSYHYAELWLLAGVVIAQMLRQPSTTQ